MFRGVPAGTESAMRRPKDIDVIGSEISGCNLAAAFDRIIGAIDRREGGYVCFTNVHTAVLGREDVDFREITNSSLLSLADGKPIYWAGRAKGAAQISHMPGPDFMLAAITKFSIRSHYFYGSTPEVLDRLMTALREKVPSINICGAFSPPFRNLSDDEIDRHCDQIRQSGAEFVWVGLGAPRQERWMSAVWRRLTPAVLFGVGAAFDFHAGTVRRAPALVRQCGLEWAYRFAQEPRRLWRRYLVTNSLFLWYCLRDAVSARSNAR